MRGLAFVLALTLAVPTAGCPSVTKPAHAIIECAKLDAAHLGAEIAKLAALIPDWKAIYATAVADIESLGVDVAGCALAQTTQEFLSRKGLPLDDGHAAHDTLERFRAQHAAGATFRTPEGDL